MEATYCNDQLQLADPPRPGPFAVEPFWQMVRTSQEPLRVELRTLARLSREEYDRLVRQYPGLFPRLHFAIGRLRDAVLTHFENEQALLRPLLRTLEEGGAEAAQDLRRLVPELVADHRHIVSVLASIRAITLSHHATADSPLLSMLLDSLRRIDRNLRALFALEDLESPRWVFRPAGSAKPEDLAHH